MNTTGYIAGYARIHSQRSLRDTPPPYKGGGIPRPENRKDNMNTKTCTKCGTTKPLNDYYNNKGGRYGKESRCKQCKSDYASVRYKANPEPQRTQARAWAEANRERSRANALNRSRSNREQHRIYSRAWRVANPNKAKSQDYVRRARFAHTVPQRWKRTTCPDHLCYWCGTTLTPNTTHIDHIMPISLGGQDTPDNTANTCANCNLTKNNTHPLVWLARITTPEPVC